MTQPIAFLPMEHKHRELRSRVEIAAHLLLRNMRVIIGQQWAMFRNIDALPRGVVLFNTVNDIKARLMARYKLHGSVVCAVDEESLFRTNHLCRTFTELAADNCDAFFAQNEHQRDAVAQRFPGVKCVLTGNPRVEISRKDFETEAAAIRAEYGGFILFNSNFSTINSVWSATEQARIVREANVAGDVSSVIAEWSRVEMLNRQEFIGALIAMAEAGETIVVRPHPAEGVAFWQAFARTWPDVHVVSGADPLAYLCACDFMVHSNSTSGLEAAILGVPCVNILAQVEADVARVTNVVNLIAQNADNVRAVYGSYRNGHNMKPMDMSATLQEFYPNIAQPGAAARIAVEMAAVAPEPVDGTGKYIYHDREDVLREKLVIDPPEMKNHAAAIEAQTGLRVAVRQMDESVFMLERAP